MAVNSSFRTLTADNIEGVTVVKNYVKSSFENGTTAGWGLFNTTLTSGIPTGTIGSGATNLTLGVTSTNPLTQNTSLQLVGTSSLVAGQGIISDIFTCDRGDLGKIFNTKFYYEAITGGGGLNVSGILGSQTLAIYIYDVSASAWIQPAGYLGINQNSGPAQISDCTFQSSVSSSQSYRVALLFLQNAANTFTMNFDNFSCSTQTAPTVPLITDPTTFTPTFTGFGSPTTTNAVYYQVGGYGYVDFEIVQGTNTAVAASVALPTGWAIDTNFTGSTETIGNWSASATPFSGNIFVQTGTSTGLAYFGSGGASATTPLNGSAWATGTTLNGSFKVKLAGKFSNVQSSSSTDTRYVALKATRVATQLITSGTPAVIAYDTVQTDTHGAFTTGASANYKVPVSGFYNIAVGTQFAPNATGTRYQNLLINGSMSGTYGVVAPGNATDNATSTFVTGRLLNAGDIIAVQASQTSGGNLNISNGTAGDERVTLEIFRLGGPSVIAATETTSARYFSCTSIISGTDSAVTYNTKDYDDHLAYSGGTYTIPVSGKYQINAKLATTDSSGNHQVSVSIYKNGTQISQSVSQGAVQVGGSTTEAQVNDIISCFGGDLITIRASDTGTGPSVITSNVRNYFSIVRVGN